MISLRPYQLQALEAIEAAYARGITRPMLVMAPGMGKTVVFAHLILRRPGRSLVLAHREELIYQAVDKIRMVAPEVDIGVVKAERDERDHACVVASVQTLAQERRLARFERDAFQTIVCDEAHHAILGSAYHRILEYFGAFAELDPPLCLGVTATPYRSGKEALGDVWQEIVYRMELQEGIAQGYLSPVKALHLQLEDLDLRQVKKTGGDYQDDALGQAISAANGPLLVSQAWQEHAQGRQTLLFTPTIELAGEMAVAFRHAGVPAESLNYLVGPTERQEMLSRYKEGETRVLANPALLTEGVDLPETSCVALCRPTKSKNLFIQCLGRATRLYPGKEDALIMDLSGCSKIHDLITLETLFKSEDKEDPPADDDEEGDEEFEGNGGPPGVRPHYLTGKLNVEEVNIFARRGEAFHWLLVFDKPKPLWVLPLGKDWICLGKACSDPGVDRWSVFTLTGKGEQVFMDTPYSLPRGYGQGIAEDLVRRNGNAKLAKPNTWWRKGPASEKQLQMIGWLGGQAGDITAGEASDMITRLKVRAALRRVMERKKGKRWVEKQI